MYYTDTSTFLVDPKGVKNISWSSIIYKYELELNKHHSGNTIPKYMSSQQTKVQVLGEQIQYMQLQICYLFTEI